MILQRMLLLLLTVLTLFHFQSFRNSGNGDTVFFQIMFTSVRTLSPHLCTLCLCKFALYFLSPFPQQLPFGIPVVNEKAVELDLKSLVIRRVIMEVIGSNEIFTFKPFQNE